MIKKLFIFSSASTLIFFILSFLSMTLPGDRSTFMGSLALSLVSVTAGVEPNQYNTLAQTLQEKEGVLSVREQAVAEKEDAMRRDVRQAQEGAYGRIILFGSAFGVVLLTLVLLNFYLDWRRGQESREQVRRGPVVRL